MVVNCEIIIDENSNGIYFSGQMLTGKVVVTTDKVKSVRGICLTVCGNAKSHWCQLRVVGSGNNKRYYSIPYDGLEDFLNLTSYLIGSENSKPLDIPIGINTYNFACALPTTIPSSFEGTFGHIRYTVHVTLERPWKFDHTYENTFTVLKQSDLNFDSPDLKIPSQVEETKTFCCWPCKSGPLLITASIPQSGYVPGQKIPITVNLKNSSNININEVKFTLNKIIKYHSQEPRIGEYTEIVEVVAEKLPKARAKLLIKFEKKLLIPEVPPTSLSICSIIDIYYEILIEIITAGSHSNPLLKMPITIGTTPLQHTFNTAIELEGYQHQTARGPHDEILPNRDIEFITVETHANIGLNSGQDQILAHTSDSHTKPTESAPHLAPPSYEKCIDDQKQS